jgi:hypothetical protein
MAESESNLFYKSGLRKFVQVGSQKVNLEFKVPRLDILFGLPNKYSEKEKKQWWKEQSDKPFKIGLIKSKELDTRVNIFGEVFDFSKTANRQGGTNVKENKTDVANSVHMAGFNTSENAVVEEVSPPETYYTSKDFDKLYLGWIPEEKARRSTLKQLFRFVFGSQRIKDVNKFHTKLLVAYTSFTPSEKVPCESKLRNDFREALEFRRTLVIKEIRATKQAIGEETMYMEQKMNILMGLRNILNTMDNKEEECFQYGFDPLMKEDVEVKEVKLDDRSSNFKDDDMERLVHIFKAYVNQMEKYKSKNTSTQGKELYDEIRKLLELSNKSGSDLANEQDLQDMTQMVEHLSFLLNAFADLHDIHIQLKDIQLDLQKEKAETLLDKTKHLEERLQPFVSGLTEGGSELSQLLYRFSQSILKQTQEDSEILQKEILGKFDTQNEQLRKLEEEKSALEEQLEKSSINMKEKQDKLKHIEEQLKTAGDSLTLVTEDIREKNAKISYNEAIKAADSERIQTLQQEKVDLEREKKKCEEELHSLQTLNQQLQEEKQQVQEQIQGFQDSLITVTKELDGTKKESESFAKEKQRIQEQFQEFENRLITAKEELDGPKKASEILSREHSALQEDFNRLKVEKEKLEKKIAEQQAPIQGGGGELSKKATCETMLTLLLFHIKDENMNVQDFLDKAGATLDDLGQCPIVLHVLNEMLDEADVMQSKENKIVYSRLESQTANDVLESIENAFQGRFNEEEQNMLATLSKPIHFFSKPPEVHEHSMGTRAYMLNDNYKNENENDDEFPLEGLVEDTIHLTKEEREAIETGGISLGALSFLYLTCLAEIQSRNETPTSSSKCLLLPKRSPERAKTPKQKHKRKVQRTKV